MKTTLLTISISAILFTGCASITKGTSQTLVFKLDPKETKCSLNRIGDGELGSVSSANNTINVGKDKDDIIVTCKAEGYEDKTTPKQNLWRHRTQHKLFQRNNALEEPATAVICRTHSTQKGITKKWRG